MAFEFTEYLEPIKAPHKNTGAFREKLEGCPVGKAFVVRGMEGQNVASRVSAIKKKIGYDFAINKIGDGEYQITRLS